MELTQLRYFQTAARLEHLTQAARVLCITQPSLSQAIARLEDELGVPLFERHGRNVQLTQFGVAYLAWVDKAFAALDAGKRELADLASSERGLIRLGTSSVAGLAQIFRAFRAQHPEVTFRLSRPSTAELFAQLVRGDIDLCISPACSLPSVTWIPLRTREVVLAVPPGHRFAGRESVALSEAVDEDFLLLKPGLAFRELTENFCRQAGFEPRIVFDGDTSMLTIVEFVHAGLGISFMLAQTVNPERQSLIVPVRISEPDCQQTLGLAWHNEHYLSQAAQSLRQFIIDYYASTNMASQQANADVLADD